MSVMDDAQRLELETAIFSDLLRTVTWWTLAPGHASSESLWRLHCRMRVLFVDNVVVKEDSVRARIKSHWHEVWQHSSRRIVPPSVSTCQKLEDLVFYSFTGNFEQVEKVIEVELDWSEAFPFGRQSQWTLPPLVIGEKSVFPEGVNDPERTSLYRVVKKHMEKWRALLETRHVPLDLLPLAWALLAEETVATSEAGQKAWVMRQVWQKVFPNCKDHPALRLLTLLEEDAVFHRIPPQEGHAFLGLDLLSDMDYGCVDGLHFGGAFLAAVEMYCTEYSSNLRGAMRAFSKMANKIKIYDYIKFIRFCEQLLDRVKGKLNISKNDVIEELLKPALLLGKERLGEQEAARLLVNEEKDRRVVRDAQGGYGYFVQFVLERALFGMEALARKIGRGFTEKEAKLAIRQVELCVAGALDLKPAAEWKAYRVNEEMVFYLGECVAEASDASKRTWTRVWKEFLEAAFERTASWMEEKETDEVYRALVNIGGDYFFSSEWRPKVGRAVGEMTELDVHVMQGLISALRTRRPYAVAGVDCEESRSGRGFLRALDSVLREMEGGFAALYPTEGDLAEVLRDRTLVEESVGLFMPQVLSMAMLEEQRFERTQMVIITCDSVMDAVQRHLVHWDLLIETGVLTREERSMIPSAKELVVVLLDEMKPWYTCGEELREEQKPGYLEDMIDYASFVRHLRVRLEGTGAGEDLSRLLAPLMVGCQLLRVPLCRGTRWWRFLENSPAEELDDRVLLEQVGVSVSKTMAPHFETQFNLLIERAGRYLRSLQLVDQTTLVFPQESQVYLHGQLQLLYAVSDLTPENPRRWSEYAQRASRQLISGMAVSRAQKQIVDRLGLDKAAKVFSVNVTNPKMCHITMVAVTQELKLPRLSVQYPEILPVEVIHFAFWEMMETGANRLALIGVADFSRMLKNVQETYRCALHQWRTVCGHYLEANCTDPMAFWLRRVEKILMYPTFWVGQPTPVLDGGASSESETATAERSEPDTPTSEDESHMSEFELSRTYFNDEPAKPAEVYKDGFWGIADKIDATTHEISGLLKSNFLDFPWLDEPSRPFQELLDLVEAVTHEIAKTQRKVTDHSGFVAMLKRELAAMNVPEAALDRLAELLGSTAIEKENARRNAVASAQEVLKHWFVLEERVSEVEEALHTTGIPESREPVAEVQVETALPMADAVEVTTSYEKWVDDESGLTGHKQRIAAFRAELPELLRQIFNQMRETQQQRGLLSVRELDELRERIRLEYLDRGLNVVNFEIWRRFLIATVRTAGDKLIPEQQRDWTSALVGTILASESGKEPKGVLYRKHSASKQAEEHATGIEGAGGEQCALRGVLIGKSTGEKLTETVVKLAKQDKDESPDNAESAVKTLAITERDAEELEIARFEAQAVVGDGGNFAAFLKESLVKEGGLDNWHAERLTEFASCQYFAASEAAKEQARLRQVLLSDPAEDFAADPATQPQRAVSDASLKVPQRLRVPYPESGLSLQAENVDDAKFFESLARIFEDHVGRWKRQRRPLAWNVVDALVRDARAEMLRSGGAVEDAATLAIAMEEKCMAPLHAFEGNGKFPCVRSVLGEYVVEMLAVWPDAKRSAASKSKLLEEHGNLFTAETSLAPIPLAIDRGFCADEATVARLERAVEAVVGRHAETWGVSGWRPQPRETLACFEHLLDVLEREKLIFYDLTAFRRFLLPIVYLTIHQRAPNAAREAEVSVDWLLGQLKLKQDQEQQQAVEEDEEEEEEKEAFAVFDGSRPDTYLEWRHLTLGRINMASLGSPEATQLLLEAAPVLGYRGAIKAETSAASNVFQASLGFLNDKFDNQAARRFILAELVTEWDKPRRKRLQELHALFVEPDEERKKIHAYIASIKNDYYKREAAEAMLGFADKTLVVFMARLKAFLARQGE